MVRLTDDLVAKAPHYINPLKQRELFLRGHQIPQIQNLGRVSTLGIDCIDFVDNAIPSITNFPKLDRLQALMLAHNRVQSIDPSSSKSLPNLQILSLQHNRIADLADLDAIAGFKKLHNIMLFNNPVAAKENYRYYVVHLNPNIRFVDLVRVTDAERKYAKQLFGTVEEPTAVKEQITRLKKTRDYGVVSETAQSNGHHATGALAPEIQDHIKRALASANTIAEVRQIEKEVKEGKFTFAIRSA